MCSKVLYTYPTEQEGMDKVKEAADRIKVLREEAPFEIPDEEFCKEIRDADALINVRMTPTSKEVIEAGQKLKIIARHGLGYDCVDLDAATKANVIVTAALGEGPHAVAEHAVGLLIALARQFKRATESVLSGEWDSKKMSGFELRGKTLGIIGLGRIGATVARMVQPFGMNVLVHDPYISQERAKNEGVKLVDLNTLLKKSHFITIHAPLTEETRGMMGEEQFGLMRDGVYIVNCARGKIIREKDLYDAVVKGKVAGIGLDVFSKEPPQKRNPLLKLDNVLFTPHVAGNTHESLRRLANSVAEDVISVLEGGLPRVEKIVNKSILKRPPWKERL